MQHETAPVRKLLKQTERLAQVQSAQMTNLKMLFQADSQAVPQADRGSVEALSVNLAYLWQLLEIHGMPLEMVVKKIQKKKMKQRLNGQAAEHPHIPPAR